MPKIDFSWLARKQRVDTTGLLCVSLQGCCVCPYRAVVCVPRPQTVTLNPKPQTLNPKL